MLLHEARRDARVGADGEIVLLEDQDRRRWRRDLIVEGSALVQRALATHHILRMRRAPNSVAGADGSRRRATASHAPWRSPCRNRNDVWWSGGWSGCWRRSPCPRTRTDADVQRPLTPRYSGSRSIMGCVIKTRPLAVLRKRLASFSGSSPTTSPAGITTPRSMTTSRSRAPRPIST